MIRWFSPWMAMVVDFMGSPFLLVLKQVMSRLSRSCWSFSSMVRARSVMGAPSLRPVWKPFITLMAEWEQSSRLWSTISYPSPRYRDSPSSILRYDSRIIRSTLVS